MFRFIVFFAFLISLAALSGAQIDEDGLEFAVDELVEPLLDDGGLVEVDVAFEGEDAEGG